MKKPEERELVVVNQAVNYLTIGMCNAFNERFRSVKLITGSIHEQGESLDEDIDVARIVKWAERPASKKAASYLFGTLQIWWMLLFRYRKHEVFFVSLPPMAYLLTLFLPNRCSVLIWDVYPDVFRITGMKPSHPVYRLWAAMNRSAFRKMKRILTIGSRMADLISTYTEREKIIVTPIWSIFQKPREITREENPFIREHNLQDKFIVQYSGNIGLTHNVETMIKLAEMMKSDKDILFQIIGRGPRMPILKKLVEEKELPNCMFLPFQPDDLFPYSLSAADVGVVILDELTSKGSVPSKSYNLMSMGIPSLYIASEDSELNDYSRRFEHAGCFAASELNRAVAFLRNLKESSTDYNTLSVNALKAAGSFRRDNADRLVDLYITGEKTGGKGHGGANASQVRNAATEEASV